MGNYGEKILLGKLRRRREDMKMDLQEEGWVDKDCIDMSQERDRWPALVNAVMNFQVP